MTTQITIPPPQTIEDLCIALNHDLDAHEDNPEGNPGVSRQDERFDLTSLPTFGGPEIHDTDGIWSWSATEILVFNNYTDSWEIEPRTDDHR
jgi:hypothetical protein